MTKTPGTPGLTWRGNKGRCGKVTARVFRGRRVKGWAWMLKEEGVAVAVLGEGFGSPDEARKEAEAYWAGLS